MSVKDNMSVKESVEKRKSGCYSRTAFVDAKCGSNRTGRVQDKNNPFRTINGAIRAINIFEPNRSATKIWQVIISPGNYGRVTVLPFINLVGSGTATITKRINIFGESTIKNFSVSDVTTPLLNVVLSNPEVNGQVIVDTINMSIVTTPDSKVLPSENNIINLDQKQGSNGEVQIVDCSVLADLTNSTQTNDNTNRFILTNLINILITDTRFEMISNAQPAIRLFEVGSGNMQISGGQSQITVRNQFPQREVIFFNAVRGGFISMRSHNSIIINTRPSEKINNPENKEVKKEIKEVKVAQNTADVTYLFSSTSGSIYNADCTIDFGTVPADQRILANVLDISDTSIVLLNTKIIDSFLPSPVPRLAGVVEKIFYFAVSRNGNLVSSGGLYTNIVTVSRPGDYFVKDNDATILVSNPLTIIQLPDPSEVSLDNLYKGKIVVIKNITDRGNVTIEAINGKIFDADSIVIAPKTSVTLQNNGIQWFIIS